MSPLNLPGFGGGAGGANSVRMDADAGHAAVQSIARVIDEMQETVNQLKSRAGQTVGTGWTGKASASFDGTHTDWNAKAVQIQAQLTDMNTALRNGVDGYATADDALAGTFQA